MHLYWFSLAIYWTSVLCLSLNLFKGCRTTESLLYFSQSVLKGSLHLSCWLTLFHTSSPPFIHPLARLLCVRQLSLILALLPNNIKAILQYHWKSTNTRGTLVQYETNSHTHVHVYFIFKLNLSDCSLSSMNYPSHICTTVLSGRFIASWLCRRVHLSVWLYAEGVTSDWHIQLRSENMTSSFRFFSLFLLFS